MLSVSDTPSDTAVAPPVRAGAMGSAIHPHSRARRAAAGVIVLAAGALALAGIANVQVARERDTVELDLATARTAAAQVAADLTDGAALGADLDRLATAAARARAGSSGPSWAVAATADLRGSQIRAVSQEVDRIGLLGDAARPLRDALAPLVTTHAIGGASMTGPEGPTGLAALDELARSLSRYTTAAERADDPSAPVLERAALAAGLLPDLAGAEGARTWTACRTATGPCLQATVKDARSGSPAEIASPTAGPTDLLVTGVDPAQVIQRAGAVDPSAVFRLLFALGSDSAGAVSVRSPVATEQQAIDQLAGR